jgi:GDP-L-fucose synthase
MDIKKVLICGASGMVGSNLVENAPPHFELIMPRSDELNLLDYENTFGYLKESMPDLIIHAAGIVGGIQANIQQPVKFLLENTDMGRNIVWAAFQLNIRAFINLGSSCMYPRDAKNPLTEDMILKGELEPTNEGYGLAKILTQRLCAYITRQYPEFKFNTIIPCNIYGRFDSFNPGKSHMVPAAILKVHNAVRANEKNVEIWGDGSVRREFLYAGDLAEMIWYLAENFSAMPGLMNLGLGHDYTINEYYRAISEVLGFQGEFSHDLSKPVGMKQKLVDITRQTDLGLKARHNLHDGIRKTYEYYLTTIEND